MQFRSNGFCLLLQNVDYAAGMIGEVRIFDPQHHLHIDKQAAQIEICGTDIYRVINDHQFHVKAFLLIFENPSVSLQQIAVQQPACPDGCGIIGFTRQYDPALTAAL